MEVKDLYLSEYTLGVLRRNIRAEHAPIIIKEDRKNVFIASGTILYACKVSIRCTMKKFNRLFVKTINMCLQNEKEKERTVSAV